MEATEAKRDTSPLFRAIILLMGAIALFARLRSPSLLGSYDDDAFYYFKIASNIATGHGSTFDTIHRTNGYHPLWMLVLVVISFVSTGKAFFILLQAVTFLCFAITFFSARRAFRYISTNVALTEIAAAVIALQTLLLIHGGMEITLTLPLAMLLCCFRLRAAFQWTSTNACLYGLLAAAVILSRLDAAFFIAPLFALEFLPIRSNSLYPRILAPLSAAIPLGLYTLSNRLWFHTWVTVSAEAKQLRLHHGFSLTPLHASRYFLHTPFGFLVVVPALLAVFACLIAALTTRPPASDPRTRIVAVSLMLLPFLQLAAFCFTSDWQIWSWYLYSFSLGTAGAFLFLFDRFPNPSTLAKPDVYLLTRGAIIVFSMLYAVTIVASPPVAFWTVWANDIASFASTHNGIYAMGDCAGTPGYLLHQPLVQLEGLTMDAAYLDNIRQQRNLNEVLHNYGVRYYVTDDTAFDNGCYHTREPAQGGPGTAHMTGLFCQQPVAEYHQGAGRLLIFDLTPNAH
jgi:hypothetical protein